jgi:hypothetical protein
MKRALFAAFTALLLGIGNGCCTAHGCLGASGACGYSDQHACDQPGGCASGIGDESHCGFCGGVGVLGGRCLRCGRLAGLRGRREVGEYVPEAIGPPGPPVATYAYPYYTIHGPRDFLKNNPPSIGP